MFYWEEKTSLEHARRTQMCNKKSSCRKTGARSGLSARKAGIDPDKTKAFMLYPRVVK